MTKRATTKKNPLGLSDFEDRRVVASKIIVTGRHNVLLSMPEVVRWARSSQMAHDSDASYPLEASR